MMPKIQKDILNSKFPEIYILFMILLTKTFKSFKKS